MFVVAFPATFVKTARYSCPFSASTVCSIVSWFEVAPGTMLHVPPPLVEISHCTVGAGNPDAAASNVAPSPASTVVLVGSCVTTGGACTVSVASCVVAEPAAFVNTARYRSPSSESDALEIVSRLDVAAGTALQVPPPSVEISHCTVGAGNPDADASNVALCPSSTVRLDGCFVIAGSFWTVSVAASLVAVPATFLKTARY